MISTPNCSYPTPCCQHKPVLHLHSRAGALASTPAHPARRGSTILAPAACALHVPVPDQDTWAVPELKPGSS